MENVRIEWYLRLQQACPEVPLLISQKCCKPVIMNSAKDVDVGIKVMR